MVTDVICGNEDPTFDYICMNIFGTWPENIVWNAINELSDYEIMYVDFHDEDFDNENEECEEEALLFNPEFIKKVCPSLDCCPCCNPAPVNFNVNYN